MLWTEDDYLGPVHVETSGGTEEWTGDVPEWAARFELSDLHAKQLAQYAEPTKAFLDSPDPEPPDPKAEPPAPSSRELLTRPDAPRGPPESPLLAI